MAEQIIFRCNECGCYFRSSDTGVRVIEEHFCHHCGKVFGYRGLNNSEVIPEFSRQGGGAGQCVECEEYLSKKIVALCPGCQTKNVKIQGTVSFF